MTSRGTTVRRSFAETFGIDRGDARLYLAVAALWIVLVFGLR